MENLYEVLGVEENATKEEIKKAYMSKVRDLTYEKDSEIYVKINKAYGILIDRQFRSEYDEKIKFENEGNVILDEKEETLYDILGADIKSTTSEIKKSYANKIRAYSPEKNPEMFQKIKNAYEILMNKDLKEEYDINLQSSEEIRVCKQNIIGAWNSQDYKTVILECKKILILNDNLHEYLYKLSQALYCDGKIDEAIKYGIELLDMCPEKYEYYKYIGILYFKKKQYTSAELYLISANDLNPQDETTIKYLIDSYIYSGRHKKAIIFLQDGIENNAENKTMKFICYKNLIRVYINKNEIEEINRVINSMQNSLNSQDDKKELADELYKMAIAICNKELYQIAELIANKSKNLYEDESINKLYEYIKFRVRIHNTYNKLEKDSRVLDEIKRSIYYYIFSDRYENKDELKKYLDENKEEIELLIENSPELIMRSTLILQKNYIELFDYRKSMYEDIYKRADYIKKLTEQYEAMDKDVEVSLGVFRLAELIMEKDLTEEEYSTRLEEIKEELSSERPLQVYNGIRRVRSNYFRIYDLNPYVLDEIEENIKPLVEEMKKKNTPSNNKNKKSNYKGIVSIVILILIAVCIPTIVRKISTIESVATQIIICALIIICLIVYAMYIYKNNKRKY